MLKHSFSSYCFVLLCTFLLACAGGNSQTEGSEHTEEQAAPSAENIALQESIKRGEAIYNGVGLCVTCHMADGKGQEGLFPPLANSDYLMGDRKRAILQVLNGAVGEMVVNGVTYNGAMPGMGATLSDEQVADVLNYVMNSWGNENEDMIKPEEVAALRE
ncbi:MAG: cytochrome c [Bacteroidetes bacterium]|nr:MAG: cytochrome c [Bacteroidota bacterium]